MALKKMEPAVAAAESKSSLSPELLSQFQSNFNASADDVQALPEDDSAKARKPNYKNIFNVHMGTGEKVRLKAFCAAREVPINTFILYAIEHLIEEIEDGKCTVSKSGIRATRKEV